MAKRTSDKKNRLIRYGLRTASRMGQEAARGGRYVLRESGDATLEGLKEAEKARRYVLRHLAHTKKLVRKLAYFLGLAIFAVMVLFLFLTAFSSLLIASGNAAGEVVYGIITDPDIKTHIEELNEKGLAKYEEAFQIALSAPEHDENAADSKGLCPDEARLGVKLYHYGSPKTKDAEDADIYHNDVSGSQTTNGYHIYYLDSRGNTVGQNTSNTKDILCLSSVMVQNDYGKRVSELAPQFFDFWSEALNPPVSYTISELYDKEGSDRFPHGERVCDGADYRCDDAGFYEAYQEAVTENVRFYEMPVPETGRGCAFDEAAYDAAVEAAKAAGKDAPDADGFYSCPGHPALSCSYGYTTSTSM